MLLGLTELPNPPLQRTGASLGRYEEVWTMIRSIARSCAVTMLLGTSLGCAGTTPAPATPTQAFSNCTATSIGDLLDVDVANLYSSDEAGKPLPAAGSNLTGPRDLLRDPAVIFLERRLQARVGQLSSLGR